ncbi:MAG: tRNA (adenosine(37)-N6)-threonylcarbamoyltransferase complex ATPase subunit type 1 TsaE [Rhodospirillales bacterium]|nr:tRNA (adenosine(37)-N6)-threonylcarbamoyltransferase complex ATPase subunit type 1 TsaE [Rhodospirillales bacterium]
MFYEEQDTHTDIAIADEAAMQALAAQISAICGVGDLIALIGKLGVGKTVFARAFVCQRLNADEEVPSPTFTLVQTYDAEPAPIAHFDLYRLNHADEVLELGFEDALAEGTVLVEWPDRLGPYLPADRLDIEISQGSQANSRTVRLTGRGYWLARVSDVINDGKIHA